MTTLTISLPESLREFVDQQVQTKGYGNVSEYFRGLLRGAQEEESERRVERLLLEALDDSRSDIEISPEFWAKKRRSLIERAEKRKQGKAKK